MALPHGAPLWGDRVLKRTLRGSPETFASNAIGVGVAVGVGVDVGVAVGDGGTGVSVGGTDVAVGPVFLQPTTRARAIITVAITAVRVDTSLPLSFLKQPSQPPNGSREQRISTMFTFAVPTAAR